MFYESENVEYKRKFMNDIYKEVIAFDNTDGGIIYVGVDDFGNSIGLENIDDIYTKITNGIRDNIYPDVTIFTKYSLLDNRVICIEVNEGSAKPYYLKSKGMKPSGVYVRQRSSSAPSSYEQIRKMIKENDDDVFEQIRSLNQDLTFTEAKKVFEKYNIAFTEEKYISLGIKKTQHNLFSNLGELLSDQCQHSIKVAVFADDANTIFKDHQEFKGSVFKQLEQTYQYLSLCNRTTSRINGLSRIDHKDYPEDALREALLNAIVHRDYSLSGSIIININETFIEFISIGGLMPGLCAEDIKNGISQPRNKHLADVFFRLKLIEAYGTGIRKIFHLYKDANRKPKIMITQNTFKIILPNMNTMNQNKTDQNDSLEITPQMQVILDYLSKHHEISESELQQLLEVKRTRAYLIARRLCEMNLITVHGKGANKVYIINNHYKQT